MINPFDVLDKSQADGRGLIFTEHWDLKCRCLPLFTHNPNSTERVVGLGTSFRVMAGLMFMAHGVQKFFGFPVEFPWPLNPMSTAAGGIELVGGALIAIGFLTRPVAFLSSGMCAIGYWMAHGSQVLFPITNGGEIIALLCFIFLFIAANGSGIWSLDKNK